MGENWRVYKKLHKWPGLIISFVMLYYGFTGIIMNHREWLSGIDLNRNIMPDNYEYMNWNNSAVRGNLILNNDSILVYGNIGIWLTDSSFREYTPFDPGFPEGVDKHRIYGLNRTPDGNIYAASFSGLYAYDRNGRKWHKLTTDKSEQLFAGIDNIGDTIYAVSRSYLYTGRSDGIKTLLIKTELPPPSGYDKRVSLFQTIWQIHSGEIFGLPGKLYVDILGLITIFLSLTGIIWFFFPGWMKRRVQRGKESAGLVRVGRWSLRWHNKVGAWTFVFLIILFLTGIFLRPPLLLAIAGSKVLPVKYSHLDQPNPWYDSLRDLLYDPERKELLLAASDGIYHMDPGELKPVIFESQPPVSIMGINVLEKYEQGSFLVGSFSGMYMWDPERDRVTDLSPGKSAEDHPGRGRSGQFTVTGMIRDTENRLYLADYNTGIQPLNHSTLFPDMPSNITDRSKISLWNFSLEIHTGRIFEKPAGGFYILIVPLAGLTGIAVVISGYILWRRKYRKQGYHNIT